MVEFEGGYLMHFPGQARIAQRTATDNIGTATRKMNAKLIFFACADLNADNV
jgi:hypothetical protein